MPQRGRTGCCVILGVSGRAVSKPMALGRNFHLLPSICALGETTRYGTSKPDGDWPGAGKGAERRSGTASGYTGEIWQNRANTTSCTKAAEEDFQTRSVGTAGCHHV